ncbi:MAG: hypothetical protein G01um101418_24 [Parcubacteria group bacterium Gr01-1014_18]|nr:MAG: hypothetical protein Greene041636_24 [Parcubacteria group bacterium Greene0416_36]TSC81530.1 MAG: hypothetical protein G01um101418_24 [Parcubacteria group bacterium Gr01-1014_18]TSC99659.1 MAG: hypothetical protein Greene101420_63 [Parcubacteria group bacterium Greene1014_20]TSD07110.1 MAG: hypothetical protein Greene07142_422 [Parcubacteria group bacterium Greene0714_2]
MDQPAGNEKKIGNFNLLVAMELEAISTKKEKKAALEKWKNLLTPEDFKTLLDNLLSEETRKLVKNDLAK